MVLENVETDCPRIRVQAVPIRIPPGGVADLFVSLDSASEPDFPGKLVIPVAGYVSGGACASSWLPRWTTPLTDSWISTP